MANIVHDCCFMIAVLLIGFALPSLQLNYARRLLSFQLHLQLPPLNQHNATLLQPLTPYLFTDKQLSDFDGRSQTHRKVGSAHGLYLVDAAASMELRYVFFTATLQSYKGGQFGRGKEEEGSLVMMGCVRSGAIAVVGGTGDFAFASGQAKVTMRAAGEEVVVSLEVELQYEGGDLAVE